MSSYNAKMKTLYYRTLHHPNILTFMGIIREPNQVILITNFVNGCNLFTLLHENPEVTVIATVNTAMIE